MVQVVDADFESLGFNLLTKLARDAVWSFRNQVERGAKAQLAFESHQASDLVQTGWPLDVMREHQSELLFLRPAGPAFGRPFRPRHNGPGSIHLPAFSNRKPAADAEADGQRHQRLDGIVEAVAEHLLNAECRMQNAGYGKRATGNGMRETGCGMRDAGCLTPSPTPQPSLLTPQPSTLTPPTLNPSEVLGQSFGDVI